VRTREGMGEGNQKVIRDLGKRGSTFPRKKKKKTSPPDKEKKGGGIAERGDGKAPIKKYAWQAGVGRTDNAVRKEQEEEGILKPLTHGGGELMRVPV